MIRVKGNSGYHKARIVFDSGSQKSYVKKSTVEKIGINPIGQESIRQALFGGNVTEVKVHNKYLLYLEDLNGRCSKEIVVLDENILCGRVPSMPRGAWMKELQHKKLWISDLQCENPDIAILIGSDYWGQLLTGKIVQLQCGLTAIETVIGLDFEWKSSN